MGSVKDTRVLRPAEENRPGYGMFIFSDRYSVFDWGEMPDKIHNKGHALCTIGLFFFSRLNKLGVRHHCIGVLSDTNILSYDDLRQPDNTFVFTVLRVARPEVRNGNYDYSACRGLKSNYLIPIEVIYRNTLPEGSSVFRRLGDGTLSIQELGLTEIPKPGERLGRPIVEVSTKLESIDRYISWDEAQEIAGLTAAEIEQIKSTTLCINDLITQETSRAGLVNEDGKIEFGFDRDRNLLVVDILGTPDECRFTYRDIPVSKEFLRKHYLATDWYQEVEAAKKVDAIRWKKLVAAQPPGLPSETVALVSSLYKSCCNEITGRQWFHVPPLESVLKKMNAE